MIDVNFHLNLIYSNIHNKVFIKLKVDNQLDKNFLTLILNINFQVLLFIWVQLIVDIIILLYQIEKEMIYLMIKNGLSSMIRQLHKLIKVKQQLKVLVEKNSPNQVKGTRKAHCHYLKINPKMHIYCSMREFKKQKQSNKTLNLY